MIVKQASSNHFKMYVLSQLCPNRTVLTVRTRANCGQRLLFPGCTAKQSDLQVWSLWTLIATSFITEGLERKGNPSLIPTDWVFM